MPSDNRSRTILERYQHPIFVHWNFRDRLRDVAFRSTDMVIHSASIRHVKYSFSCCESSFKDNSLTVSVFLLIRRYCWRARYKFV